MASLKDMLPSMLTRDASKEITKNARTVHKGRAWSQTEAAMLNNKNKEKRSMELQEWLGHRVVSFVSFVFLVYRFISGCNTRLTFI
jgi:hypothetical protein